jgi:hypothetical protein
MVGKLRTVQGPASFARRADPPCLMPRCPTTPAQTATSRLPMTTGASSATMAHGRPADPLRSPAARGAGGLGYFSVHGTGHRKTSRNVPDDVQLNYALVVSEEEDPPEQ